jgi:hypothetical protein
MTLEPVQCGVRRKARSEKMVVAGSAATLGNGGAPAFGEGSPGLAAWHVAHSCADSIAPFEASARAVPPAAIAISAATKGNFGVRIFG